MPSIEVGENDLVVVLSGPKAPGSAYIHAKVMVGNRQIGMLSQLDMSLSYAEAFPTVKATFLKDLTFESAAFMPPDLSARAIENAELVAGTGFVTVETPWKTYNTWGRPPTAPGVTAPEMIVVPDNGGE